MAVSGVDHCAPPPLLLQDVIRIWYRLLGTWEMIHNPNFKVVEFDHFRIQAGLPSFVMSVSEWIEKTNAIGILHFFCKREMNFGV